MKLPFNIVLGPLIKPYLGRTRVFCHHPIFEFKIIYTYIYGVFGFLISALSLKKHFGEPYPIRLTNNTRCQAQDFMILHDLKIIGTSMGLIQYACLIIGCLTENPSLFLPHLIGQLIIVTVKVLNSMLLLVPPNIKTLSKLIFNFPALVLMVFNWLQEFCVFRQYICICDL